MSLPPPGPDRTAVVTGASSGIGTEIARDLARRGHGVTLVARREETLRQLAEELGRGGVRAEVLPTDLTDREARARLPERVAELGLVPDVLVNDAGLSTLGPVHATDPDAELAMLEVDVMALADLCNRFLPGMVERGRGAVLNLASTAAFQPLPGQAGYAAAKAFVLSYTRSMAAELKGTGVTATALCPGPVETEFAERAGFSQDGAKAALPDFLWVPASEVARTGVEALDRGRVVAIPGAANRVTAAASTLVPKRLLVPLLARRHPALHDRHAR